MKILLAGLCGLLIGAMISWVIAARIEVKDQLGQAAAELDQAMKFYHYAESGNSEQISRFIRVSFNPIYCQAVVLRDLPTISSEPFDGILQRADEFRSNQLGQSSGNPSTEDELACIF